MERTFLQFMEAKALDPSLAGAASIHKTGEGGRKYPKLADRGARIEKDRRKPEGATKRMKAVGGGKMVPADRYKDRKDIGQTKARSEREQQPEKARDDKQVKQSYADKVKAERKRQAQARIAAKKSGGEVKKTTTTSASAEKKATELLKTKKAAPVKTTPAKPRRSWEHEGGGGMTRQERDKARNKEKGSALKNKKAELIKSFTDTHGRAPKGTERTKLIGLAHKASKAGV